MKKIKIYILTVLSTIFLFSAGFAQTNQQTADKITGLYWSPKKDAKIEIYKKGEQYFGRSIWVARSRIDNKNPNAALKTREVLGIELLSNFVYNDGIYIDGKIYDPESGKIYNCKMSWEGQDLRIRGYIGISLFGRTEIFERVK